MRKFAITVLSVLLTLCVVAQPGRLFDQPMKIKQMNIRVSSDCFTVSTFIEIEFYNNKDQEVEGAYHFQLQPGQVITNLQLDLDGKYRDGSIEERWKAANAYNTIVGKRVDPALLQYVNTDMYKLSIYPVPARSSRKITMTIHQLLTEEKGVLSYKLPLQGADSIASFNITIATAQCFSRPVTTSGLLANSVFSANGKGYDLSYVQRNLKLPSAFGFTIATKGEAIMRIKQVDGKKYFALRFTPQESRQLQINARKILVYWDVSLSGANRDRNKDIDFLEKYMARHNTEAITIVSFSGTKKSPVKFTATGNHWKKYLQNLSFEGGTRFDDLDFSDYLADAILLFSDGQRTIGKMPVEKTWAPVFAISSSYGPDSLFLKQLPGRSGGRFIDLFRTNTTDAVAKASVTESDHFTIQGLSERTNFKVRTDGPNSPVLVYGVYKDDDHIMVRYGTATTVSTDMFSVTGPFDESSSIDRIDMLLAYPQMTRSADWNAQLDFGIDHRVVTPRTSFLVLERVEDYVRYNITPPKELEEACKAQGFVKQNTKELRQQEKLRQDYNNLWGVMNGYSRILIDHGITSIPATITQSGFDDYKQNMLDAVETDEASVVEKSTFIPVSEDKLEEVVVTSAYGMQKRKSELGYSSTQIVSRELTQSKSVNVQGALTGKVSGLNVTTTNNGVFEDTRLTLRGIRSLTGNNQPLLVYDGSVVPLRYISQINPNDIEHITILKGATGAALYGSEGVNGVILVTSKQYKGTSKFRTYKLKDMPEEEYIQQLERAPLSQKVMEYAILKKTYGNSSLFYVEAAQHLYRNGMKEKAKEVLLNAAEVSKGDPMVMHAIAFILEEWKEYEDALTVYFQLPQNHEVVRTIAWCYYQAGKKQEAVDFLFDVIRDAPLNVWEKAHLADDMNAMIAVNKGIVTTKIPKEFLVAKPVDLRILLTSNTGTFNTMNVYKEGTKSTFAAPSNTDAYYQRTMNIQQFKNAERGKYKVKVQHYDWNGWTVPMVIRMVVFRNFGKPDQTIEVENIIMNNQTGEVEIAEVKW